MRIIFFVLLIAVVSFSAGVFLTVPVFAGEAESSKVIAYYFHGAARCPTCHKLEQYSKEAIEANFKDALASGKLEFKIVNVEERGNEHFVDYYQLYTKSLVLSLVKDGKEVRSRNLSKIWEYVGNKERFIAYVKEEVAAFLGGS